MNPQTGSDTGRGKEKATPGSSTDPAAQRKRLFSVILFVGVSALLIGGFSLYESLRNPFSSLLANANTNTTNSADISDAVAVLKDRDTDGDGLTDYEELYIYETSPFLSDTDADGTSDSGEINADTDPNCPEGSNCGAVAANTNANGNTNSALTTVSALRQALIDSGASASVINNLDDQTIIEQYEAAVSGDSTTAENTNSSLVNADLEDLTAEQLRTLLTANGISSSSLDTIDDDTLLSVYYDALTNTSP